MTDFQMTLIAAGGVFVAGVISYNKWQEYKARKSVERAFASDHDDVLMRSGESPLEGAASERGPVDRQEPVLDVPDVALELLEAEEGVLVGLYGHHGGLLGILPRTELGGGDLPYGDPLLEGS